MLRCCCGSQTSDDDEELKIRGDDRGLSAVFVSQTGSCVHPAVLEARAPPEVLVLQDGIERERLSLQHRPEMPRVPSEERSGLGLESSEATQSRGDLQHGSVLLQHP